MASMDTVKNTIMTKKSTDPTAELQTMTQDDNASKTPLANAEDIDILAFHLMATVNIVSQLAQKVADLEAMINGQQAQESPDTQTPGSTANTAE